MLHKMFVFSAETIFSTLNDQINQPVDLKEFLQPIPDSIEEQEKVLQVMLIQVYLSYYFLS